MAQHEFGIMPDTPSPNERFDTYEPEKYGCILVADEYIEPILPKLEKLQCFWHTTAIPQMGLCYFGITLIPPSSLDTFGKLIKMDWHFSELYRLIRDAGKQNKFIIHFGI